MRTAEAKHGLHAVGNSWPAEDSGGTLALSDEDCAGAIIPGLRLCFVAFCEH